MPRGERFESVSPLCVAELPFGKRVERTPMKRHPSSWSLLFAAPRSEARIFRRSPRAKTPQEAMPLVGASDTEVDALLAQLDGPTIVEPVPPTQPETPLAMRPPRARHEAQLSKVIVPSELVAKPTDGAPRRRRRDLDVTVIAQRRVRPALLLPPRASLAGSVLSPLRRRERLHHERMVLVARIILSASFVSLLCALAFLAGSR